MNNFVSKNSTLSTVSMLVCTLLYSNTACMAAKTDVLVVTSSENNNDSPRGYANKTQFTATKGSASLLETPQFVSVIKREQMDTLPSESISQALRYSAGVTSEKFGAFGNGIDFSKIRGFDADYYLDGLRVIGNSGIWGPQIDSWTLNSIEAVHGPSSALYGQGGAGGVINMQSRRPSANESHQIQFQKGNFDNDSIKFDTTGALNDSETLLYRMDGLALSTDSQINSSKQSRYLLAPSLTWQPNEKLSLTVLSQYQRDPHIGHYNTLPAQAIGLLPNRNGKLDFTQNYSDPRHEQSERTQWSITSLIDYQITPFITFKQNIRYSDVDTHIKRDFTRGFLASDQRLTAVYQDSPSHSKTWVADNQLIYQLDTGPIRHQLLFGFDYQTGQLDKDWWGSQTVSFDPWVKPHHPEFRPYPVSRTSTTQRFDRYGVYLQDQLSWQQWDLLLSGRYDWSYLNTDNNLTNTTQKNDTSAWSQRVGLTYSFESGFSPWVSVSDSFDPVLGTDAEGKPFIPTESKQTELGIKYQNQSGDLMVSLAAYELEQKNVTTHNPLNPDYYNQTGKIRSRGIDFESRFAITTSLNMMLNYAYTDNKITQSQDLSVLNKHPVQVPKHSGSAWVDYRFHSPYLEGALVGVGVRYLGATWGDNTNTFKVPAVWLGDVSARYQMDALIPELTGMELGVTVSNITNNPYVASCTSSTYCSIGTNRTLFATLNYYF
ncbi:MULTISPECIES: TonB-dependent siderophore receptor [Providencia]|uniref:TonB-dependent siderophore receptor n=1 Tax=Providencia TaxID=586 RepID=UPI0014191D0C|nr:MULTISPECIES: TonB-dependent siderophore receptor [Providencia]EJD6080176.1 TonB-dependent siderophore receptor [Providencia rettgeri]EJD6084094.1 TonB-dependent siderophore receptor [Providencia rettgeri]EJD6498957.1 TonB-dependent siderophore receptor [Providencia rettgeri]EJD6501699.1 TonB-dependent siderophore receptor [Providencia rettgeri]EJD6582808.1 TonB-dependent siderophore receptor [Providencia rettgeri]